GERPGGYPRRRQRISTRLTRRAERDPALRASTAFTSPFRPATRDASCRRVRFSSNRSASHSLPSTGSHPSVGFGLPVGSDRADLDRATETSGGDAGSAPYSSHEVRRHRYL